MNNFNNFFESIEDILSNGIFGNNKIKKTKKVKKEKVKKDTNKPKREYCRKVKPEDIVTEFRPEFLFPQVCKMYKHN